MRGGVVLRGNGDSVLCTSKKFSALILNPSITTPFSLLRLISDQEVSVVKKVRCCPAPSSPV